MNFRDKIKPAVVGLIGAVLFIMGLQLILVPSIHLLDIYIFGWNLWPSMTLLKAILISITGLLSYVAGRLIGQSIENPFFDPDVGENR